MRILHVIPFFARSMGSPVVATHGFSRELVMASDTCILPAHDDEIMRNIAPIKIYEYMAAGKPVIATRLPGLVKEFGEDNGVLYIDKPEEVLKLAEELEESKKILSEGIKTRKFIEPSSWDIVVGKFEEKLIHLIGKMR